MKTKIRKEFEKDYEEFKEGVGEIKRHIKGVIKKKGKGHGFSVRKYKFGLNIISWR